MCSAARPRHSDSHLFKIPTTKSRKQVSASVFAETRNFLIYMTVVFCYLCITKFAPHYKDKFFVCENLLGNKPTADSEKVHS